jgi:hypothetical protein
MIIVIHDLCKKENNMQKKRRTKMPCSREEGKSFGMELKQELWRAFLSPLVSAII